MDSKRKLSHSEQKKYISLRRAFNKPVIGITGYLGKSTTLEMLSSILESRGKVLKNAHGFGNWQNNIATLEKLNSEYDYALFEFDYQRGNHFSEILRLIKPTIGIVTNIGDAHLNYLGNMMEIALEKSAVVKYLARDGVAILNKDDELSSSLANYITKAKVVKYGLSPNSDYFATDIRQVGPEGINFRLNGEYEITLPLFSIPDVYNFLGAAASAVNLGFSLQEIVAIFKSGFQMSRGRGRLIKINNFYVLDESYVGTPRSVSKAARSLIAFKPYSEKLIYIVGDMTESGPNIEEQHLNMGYFLSALPIDYLITVGDYAGYIAKGASLIRTNHKKIFSVNTIDEILSVLNDLVDDNAAISVKGIGSVAMHRIEKFLQTRFENVHL
ncbi:MAG: Mur ligase family protein [Calditrichaceae bacterium]